MPKRESMFQVHILQGPKRKTGFTYGAGAADGDSVKSPRELRPFVSCFVYTLRACSYVTLTRKYLLTHSQLFEDKHCVGLRGGRCASS